MWAIGVVACGRPGGQDDPGRIGISLRPLDDGSAVVEIAGLSSAAIGALDDLDSPEAWARVFRVSVHHSGQSEEVPAVLGSYSIHGTSVRFTPMFPFDRGREYLVTFDAARLSGADVAAATAAPIASVVALPKADVDPTTIVEQVYPTRSTLPENQLKLYIQFSAPMSAIDGLPYIHLLDEGGAEIDAPFLPLGAEFWDYDHQRYTVFFDPGRVKRGILSHEKLGRPLKEGRSYTLVIDRAWLDAEGNPLKAPYRREFKVGPPDTAPLDPATWTFEAPRASTDQALVVSFSEPLDHGLLLRALGVEEAGGQPLDGAIEIGGEETEWRFTPAAPSSG